MPTTAFSQSGKKRLWFQCRLPLLLFTYPLQILCPPFSLWNKLSWHQCWPSISLFPLLLRTIRQLSKSHTPFCCLTYNPSVHMQVFSFSTICERQAILGTLILWRYDSCIGATITHSTTMNKRREIALMQFAGTKDNAQSKRISDISICLGLTSLHSHKARVRPAHKCPNNDTSLSILPEHGKVLGILLIIFLTQYSFHEDFSEVYEHFDEELVTSLLILPGYTRLICCTGGMGIHQQTPVFIHSGVSQSSQQI